MTGHTDMTHGAGRHWWQDPAEVGVAPVRQHHNALLDHAESCMEAARIEQAAYQRERSVMTPEERAAAFERTYRWVAQAEDARYITKRLEEHENPESQQQIAPEMVEAYHQIQGENPHLNVRLEPEQTDVWIMPDDADYSAFRRGETWNVDTDDIDARGIGKSWSLVAEEPESMRSVKVVDDQFDYGGLGQNKRVTVGVVQPPEHYNWREPDTTPEDWETSTRIPVEFDDIQTDADGYVVGSTTETDWSPAIERARDLMARELPAPSIETNEDPHLSAQQDIDNQRRQHAHAQPEQERQPSAIAHSPDRHDEGRSYRVSSSEVASESQEPVRTTRKEFQEKVLGNDWEHITDEQRVSRVRGFIGQKQHAAQSQEQVDPASKPTTAARQLPANYQAPIAEITTSETTLEVD